VGIVVHCPNGHRINIKAALAGKKGFCPHCGAKFRIPTAEQLNPPPDLPAARLLPLDAATIATLPRALAFDMPAAHAAPPQQPDSVPLHPVIAEQPDLSWCIAFPGGEPTPPMPAATMQAWLDSGEATGDEVVWRSDWPEWRPVRDVFG
jgi:hypothetical protein